MRALFATIAAITATACVPRSPVDADTTPALPMAFSDPAADGPYDVGISTFLLPEVAGYTDVPVEVWYPTSSPSAELTSYDFVGIPFPARGYRDVPPDLSAPNLVVAFSHGFGGARQQNYTMAERLASHGFVVVAPDHPGTTTLDFLGTYGDLGPSLLRRPFTVRAAVDATLDGAVEGLVLQRETYGMIGHSLGAWTALAAGGGALSSDAYRAACDGDEHPGSCDIIGDISYTDEEVEQYGQPDPRVTTTILQSPGGYYSFEPSSLARIQRPLVVGGTLDDTLPYDAETVPTFDLLASPATLMTLEGAGHYGYTNMCDISIATLFAKDCAGVDGGFADPFVVRELAAAYVVAWMGSTLGEQEQYGEWLGARDGVGWLEK